MPGDVLVVLCFFGEGLANVSSYFVREGNTMDCLFLCFAETPQRLFAKIPAIEQNDSVPLTVELEH